MIRASFLYPMVDEAAGRGEAVLAARAAQEAFESRAVHKYAFPIAPVGEAAEAGAARRRVSCLPQLGQTLAPAGDAMLVRHRETLPLSYLRRSFLRIGRAAFGQVRGGGVGGFKGGVFCPGGGLSREPCVGPVPCTCRDAGTYRIPGLFRGEGERAARSKTRSRGTAGGGVGGRLPRDGLGRAVSAQDGASFRPAGFDFLGALGVRRADRCFPSSGLPGLRGSDPGSHRCTWLLHQGIYHLRGTVAAGYHPIPRCKDPSSASRAGGLIPGDAGVLAENAARSYRERSGCPMRSLCVTALCVVQSRPGDRGLPPHLSSNLTVKGVGGARGGATKPDHTTRLV